MRLFSWVVLSSLFRQVAFLVVNVVLFARLTRSTYGAIALGFSYLSVFGGLGELGIRQIAWREVARHPRRVVELTASFLSAKTVTAVAAFLVYLVLMPLLWEPDLPTGVFLLFGLAIILNGGTFEFPLYGLNRMDVVARFSFVAYALYLSSCLLLVRGDGRAWLVPALFVTSMGALLALEVGWFRHRHGPVRLRLRYGEFRAVLRDSWPLGAGETVNRLALTYPVILLGVVADSEAVGNYRLAELAYSFLAQFGHLFASAAFTQLSHGFHHQRSEVASSFLKMLLWMVGGAVVAGLGLYLFGPALLRMALKGRLPEESDSVLRVLAAALVFAGPVRFLKALLAGIDRQSVVLLVNVIAVVSGVALGWAASLRFGIPGMAGAVLATECLTACILLGVYWRALGPAAAVP